MSANAEIIAELRRVLNERDEAREQLDLTKRELGRWVDRETKAVRERDEARAESAKWKAGFEEFRSRNTDLMMQLFEAQEKVRAVNIGPMLHLNAQLRSKVHGLSAEVERLMHQLADQTNETTRARLEAKRAAEEAYLRGAEAMREACEAAIHAAPEGAFAERVIRALPIPEEP